MPWWNPTDWKSPVEMPGISDWWKDRMPEHTPGLGGLVNQVWNWGGFVRPPGGQQVGGSTWGGLTGLAGGGKDESAGAAEEAAKPSTTQTQLRELVEQSMIDKLSRPAATFAPLELQQMMGEAIKPYYQDARSDVQKMAAAARGAGMDPALASQYEAMSNDTAHAYMQQAMLMPQYNQLVSSYEANQKRGDLMTQAIQYLSTTGGTAGVDITGS